MTVARIFRPRLNRSAHRVEPTRPGAFGQPVVRAIAAAVLYLSLLPPLPGQPPKPTEYQVKAEYLTNFGRFVKKWSDRAMPSSAESFDICVLGQDPFGVALDGAVKGEEINGAPMAARRVAKVQDALGCRVLFISSPESSQLTAILAALGPAPILTVADTPDFVRRGGMVQFVLEGNKVKFEINLAAAQHAGLGLSSDLLNVARAVRRTM